MLTETTIAAFRTLIHLVLMKSEEPVPPKRLASQLGLSPSYLAKMANSLVKANIVRSTRGAKGGITVDREPQSISMLEIVEACQGKILAPFCEQASDLRRVCGFHRAMVELHDCTVGTLSRWSLADLVERPWPSAEMEKTVDCRVRVPR